MSYSPALTSSTLVLVVGKTVIATARSAVLSGSNTSARIAAEVCGEVGYDLDKAMRANARMQWKNDESRECAFVIDERLMSASCGG